MTNASNIEQEIKQDWKGYPEVIDICLKIYSYVLMRLPKLNYITYSLINQILGSGYSEENILAALQYLCGYKISILEAKFEYVDESDEIFQISNRELKDALENNFFEHPFTGRPVANFEDQISMYFVPNQRLKEKYAS